ncbi:unnamed protein product [Tenebrio molitor]|nr:unnamed protein product [Tenebrio molitor]
MQRWNSEKPNFFTRNSSAFCSVGLQVCNLKSSNISLFLINESSADFPAWGK